MNIYISEYGSVAGINQNTLYVKKDDNIISEFPIEKIESVTLFTSAQITSQCIEALSKKEIPISWISYVGKVVGCLDNYDSKDVFKQQMQFERLKDENFRIAMSKKFITAKLNNQSVFLKRLNRDHEFKDVMQIANDIKIFEEQALSAKNIGEIMGIEGVSARIYFEGLRYFIPSEYNFEKRTKNPPKDYASSVFSFLYTLLFNDVLIAVQNAGFNPYVGTMHSLKKGHPALVSDLMEEFRSVISDAVVMDYIKNNSIKEDSFYKTDSNSIYTGRRTAKELIRLYETKMHSNFSYCKKNGVKNDFRTALSIQVYEYFEALEANNSELYDSIRIR